MTTGASPPVAPPTRRVRWRILAAGILLSALLAGGAWLAWARAVPTASGPLPQQAYLWQREWTDNVRAAVAGADAGGSPLAGLCVAYAEIGPDTRPIVKRTLDIDWPLLTQGRQPVGFAVRVREFPGGVEPGSEPFRALRGVLRQLVAEAEARGVHPTEVQVDYDCPTSRLRGFAGWLRVLKTEFPAQHFSFTALPAWLRSRDFAELAAVTGDYVLQVHWLETPGPDRLPPATLCDPVRARDAVQRAARLGVPFRVALPTYGYRLVLDAGGRLLAGTGEGSALEAARPPPGGSVRNLMADPAAMAGLVAAWQARRPAALRGVIWYRLPVPGDRLNWTARTLWTVATGRRSAPALVARIVQATAGGPYEVRLCNDGDADAPLTARVAVQCPVPPLASDCLGGYALGPGKDLLKDLVFTPRISSGESPRVLPAGATVAVGWVRLPDASAPPPTAAVMLPAANESAIPPP